MGRGTKSKPGPEESARNYEIYDLVVRQGWSQHRVARKYEISQPSVSRICAAVDEELRHQFIKDIRSIRMRHSQLLEELIHQAMEAWHRSYGTSVTTTSGRCKAAGCAGNFETTTTKELAGDVRFLLAIDKFLESIRSVWSADLKAGERGRGGKRWSGKPIAEQRAEMRAELQKMLEKINTPSAN